MQATAGRAGRPSGFHWPADFKGSLLATSSSLAACREELGRLKGWLGPAELPSGPSLAQDTYGGRGTPST